MTTLRLDDNAPYQPADPKTEKVAAEIDALGLRDGVVTMDEVINAPTPLQNRLFSALAWGDFHDKWMAWQKAPLIPVIKGVLFGDPARDDVQRTAEVANIVGRLPGVDGMVNPGKMRLLWPSTTMSIGARSTSER